jgi:hypothetical protein
VTIRIPWAEDILSTGIMQLKGPTEIQGCSSSGQSLIFTFNYILYLKKLFIGARTV